MFAFGNKCLSALSSWKKSISVSKFHFRQIHCFFPGFHDFQCFFHVFHAFCCFLLFWEFFLRFRCVSLIFVVFCCFGVSGPRTARSGR